LKTQLYPPAVYLPSLPLHFKNKLLLTNISQFCLTIYIPITKTTMAWTYLILAGIFEMGWPLGLKLSQTGVSKIGGIMLAVLSMAISGAFLWAAQKSIPIGTAYAVWTGIGAAGTFFIGILFFNDPANFWRIFSGLLIIMGVIGLKLSV
jgi:quaternary ammonium compound-resistance protein SugE